MGVNMERYVYVWSWGTEYFTKLIKYLPYFQIWICNGENEGMKEECEYKNTIQIYALHVLYLCLFVNP